MVPGMGWRMMSGVLGSWVGSLYRAASGAPERMDWMWPVLAPVRSASSAVTAWVTWVLSFSQMRAVSSVVIWAMSTPASVRIGEITSPGLASLAGSMGDWACLAETMNF